MVLASARTPRPGGIIIQERRGPSPTSPAPPLTPITTTEPSLSQKYDVAAYVWPSYHHDPRARIFWPQGIGEWETVLKNGPKFEGHEQPRLPLWGPVNEADPYVMQMQIDAAADHGVNVFIYDWYWYDGLPFLEGCLDDGYLKAKNNDRVKFYLMWANHDVNTTWDKRNAGKVDPKSLIWRGAQDLSQFKAIARRVIERYFPHPSYYRIGGKPCFSIYDLRALVEGLGGVEEARRALDWFREETRKAGFPDLDIQYTIRGKMSLNLSGVDGGPAMDQKDLVAKLGLDSLTHYQYVHFTDVDRDYAEIQADAEKVWAELARDYSIPYYPHVSIGWDNNPRYEMFRPGVVKKNTPEAFGKALLAAKAFADARPKQAPLITINSWNEWTETSYLQPCSLFGYGYLEAVKRVFGG
ncbi:MAG: glycoside hydrolase family 99-like domain-containing protein [Spirochaetes bacterium]|nr:glycoside hydrolase family 99-like domain-containing protein [Spirochaetota bacterium]